MGRRHYIDWTDARIEILRREWAAGMSGPLIAERLGISRSAVIGKAKRLGLARRRPGRKGNAAKAGQVEIPASPPVLACSQPRVRKRRSPAGALPNTVLGINPGFQAPAPRTCQWIEGEPCDRDFCGKPARPGSSYCDAHHARCWVRPETRQADRPAPTN